MGVVNTSNPTTFTTTVAQNAVRNDGLAVLWRSRCWAMRPPGQPPTSPVRIQPPGIDNIVKPVKSG